MEILKQGAEATLYKATRKKTPMLIKKRVEKGYRIKELDENIRKNRTRKEALLLVAARKAGVNTPIIYDIDLNQYEIIMQYIEGSTVKEMIDESTIADQKNLCKKIGENIALLHNAGIIHGDLTTSNMILSNNRLYFIDFGLSTKSTNIEDFGVDLHVLAEAFKAAHANPQLFEWTINTYKKSFDKGEAVELKIDEITKRGRYMKRVT